MESFFSKRRAIILIVILLIGGGTLGALFLLKKTLPVIPTIEPAPEKAFRHEIIGKSVEGRNIEAYTYGTGTTPILFVGGVHGGYEWNSVSLAYKFIDYLDTKPDIPKNLKITVIPSLNPDGVYKVTGKEGRFDLSAVSKEKKILEGARFNANKVDLNRNFDCKWQPQSAWREKIVSAGQKAFSEPEAQALRDFVLEQKPVAVLFWHSQANAVYASECESGILPETLRLVDIYAKASGYQAIKTFDNYKVTGDAEGWLASISIPAITVELKTHEDIEWEKNLAGFKALLNYYSIISPN